MKIILSPAKKMKVETDILETIGLPDYIDKSVEILEWLENPKRN